MRADEPPATGPLTGIRVLDAGLLVQGPYAGQALVDLGADVIKIEMPNVGDYARWVPTSSRDRRPPWFIACNRGKRSICVDLRQAQGQELVRRLADCSDVVISNFVPGTMEAWGLSYDVLAERNPRIVYAAASAFGEQGTRARQPGLDIAGQAASGLVAGTGPAGSVGYPAGATVGDHIGSLNLTIGILAALVARARTGRGQRVTTSLVGGLVAAQAAELTACSLGRAPQAPAGRGHSLFRTLYGIFTTADGGIAITNVPETRRAAFWSAVGLAGVAGRPDLNGPLTAEGRHELTRMLDDALSKQPTSHWCSVFTDLGVDHAPVRTLQDVAEDPDMYLNGYLQRLDHRTWGTVTMPGSPIGLSGTPVNPGRLAPGLGEHTVEILRDLLSATDDDVTRWREQRTI